MKEMTRASAVVVACTLVASAASFCTEAAFAQADAGFGEVHSQAISERNSAPGPSMGNVEWMREGQFRKGAPYRGSVSIDSKQGVFAPVIGSVSAAEQDSALHSLEREIVELRSTGSLDFAQDKLPRAFGFTQNLATSAQEQNLSAGQEQSPSTVQEQEQSPSITPETDSDSITQVEEPGPPRKGNPLLDRRDRIFYPGDTERLKPLGKKLLLNILLDQKEIFTSPFRMNAHTAPLWLLGAGVTGGLIAADKHIADSFANSRGQVTWGGRISRIGAPSTVVPVIIAYYGYGVWRDHAKAREIGVLGTESVIDSLILVGVLKEIARRNRPDEEDPGKFWGGGKSFPSGHSIQMWSLASLIAHEYKHRPIVQVVAYSLAGLVSASRIAARQHFASDIVSSGFMGWFIGKYVYETHMSHLAHKHSFLTPTVMPHFDPVQHGFGVSLVFGGGGE
jgi:membrane-associated phospholipid phosphatase